MVDPRAHRRLKSLGEEIIGLANTSETCEETALAGLAQVHSYFAKSDDRQFGTPADPHAMLPPQYWQAAVPLQPGYNIAGALGIQIMPVTMVANPYIMAQMPAVPPPAPKKKTRSAPSRTTQV